MCPNFELLVKNGERTYSAVCVLTDTVRALVVLGVRFYLMFRNAACVYFCYEGKLSCGRKISTLDMVELALRSVTPCQVQSRNAEEC